MCLFSSVQSFSHVRLFGTSMDCSMPGLPVHHQLLELAQTHVHPVRDSIQPSHPLSSPSYLQSFPASGSFPMSPFFSSSGQSIGVSASASVLPMNIQNWFPLGLTCLISLQPLLKTTCFCLSCFFHWQDPSFLTSHTFGMVQVSSPYHWKIFHN